MSSEPPAGDSALRDATWRLLEPPLDIVIATTGTGFRRWVEAADAWGIGEQLRKVIGQATLLARGPEARDAIRAAGLREAWSAESLGEVLEHLTAGALEGKRVAVQLPGEPLPDLVQAPRRAGAEVIEVPAH